MAYTANKPWLDSDLDDIWAAGRFKDELDAYQDVGVDWGVI